jgi:uncharacterized SAM-binding protein YcdF (DUF218 family)
MISFTLSKLLSLLVYPLSLSLLLCVVALILARFRRESASFYTLLFAVVWLYLSATPFFANFLIGTLERGYGSRAMSAVSEAEAIVLLGGATRGDTHMGTLPDLNQHADRLVHAVSLYKAGKAPLILLSGGSASGSRPEAQQMRDVLGVMGVPAKNLILENASRDTHDNAVFSAQILRDRGIKRILLVTSAYHMRRAMALFEAEGLEVEAAPTDYQQLVAEPVIPIWLPGVGSLARTSNALHEMAGYWVYRWRGWL